CIFAAGGTGVTRTRRDMGERWAAVRAGRPIPNPSGLCQCGCGRQTRIARSTDAGTGDVKGCARKYLRVHNKRAATPFVIDPVTGCHECQLATDVKGYGSVKVNGRTRRSHVVAYEAKYGPVPVGMELHHCCPGEPNRLCCN